MLRKAAVPKRICDRRRAQNAMHYTIANIIGFIIVIFYAYLLQNRFVFKTKMHEKSQRWWIILLKTYLSYAFTGLLLTNFLSWVWIDVLDLSLLLHSVYIKSTPFCNWKSNADFAKYFAPFLNCIIMVPANFIINKFWIYRTPRTKNI